MGKGIITHNGASPLVEWRIRLKYIDSPELSANVQRLLQGLSVVSQDGVLELAFQAEQPPLYRLIARRPSAPYVVDIYLRALQAEDSSLVSIADRDTRDPEPTPAQWFQISQSRTEFELFNCVLHSLKTRKNVL